MLGFIASIVCFFILPGAAWERALTDIGNPWLFATSALLLVAGAWIVGLIFARTVGMAAMGYMAGAAVAAVIALFTGQFGYVLPLVIHALAGWVVQMGQARRVGIA